MIANFYDVFDDAPDSSEIPSEIKEILLQDLPNNFTFYKDENGQYTIGPKPNKALKLKVDLPEDIVEELKGIPHEQWPEYLYRTQRAIPVTNARIGDDDKLIPIEQTSGDPFGEPPTIVETWMYPAPFPEAKPMLIETAEGDKVKLMIKQQPYPSMEETKFASTNFEALKLEIYISDQPRASRITYSVTPQKAKSVDDAVVALHIFKGFYEGTVKIDGKLFSDPLIGEKSFDKEQIESALEMWTIAAKLEKILEVSFNPAAEFPVDDVRFFSELRTCLIDDKYILWEHPFEHFHIGGIHMENGSIEDVFEKEGVSYRFKEGPIEASLLGAEFEIYSDTQMYDLVITGIQWDDDTHDSGELYITDASNTKWKLRRKYMTSKQIQALEF